MPNKRKNRRTSAKRLKKLRKLVEYKQGLKQILRTLPGKSDPIPKGSKCLICKHTRALDRCHIVPLRFLSRLADIVFNKKLREEYLGYNGKNIVVLCKNHHFLYDTFRLTKQEFKILTPYVASLLFTFDEWMADGFKAVGKGRDHTTKNYIASLEKWLSKFGIYANTKTKKSS